MTRFPLIRFVTLLMIAAIPFTAFAADSVGRQTGGGSAIAWQLNVNNYDSVRLRAVSPSGEVFEKLFRAGQTVQIRTSDLGELEAGTYQYELTVNPRVSSDVKAKLAKARAANDDAAARKIMKEAGLAPVSQSGAFTVNESLSFVTPGLLEDDANDAASLDTSLRGGSISANVTRPRNAPVETLDQVIPDDLIVQGSGCFGFDCVNNESFGFDTIRLKENNLRIKAEDTSVGSFPTNDWELTFNDSASGGASKFSVTDVTGSRVPMTITAGATTNSIFVDSTGRVGFRTSTPVLDLHVNTSNTPAIRLEQNNTGGFSAQTWDIGANEANFFVRDVTSGSRLPLRIRPGAPTSSLDISASGNVGIGTASPARLLHLTSSSGNAALQWTNSSAKSWHVANAGNDFNVSETGVADARLYVQAGGNVGIACNAPGARLVVASGAGCANPSSSLNPGDAQFTVASSRTFKENISPVTVPDVLDRIGKVGVYNYDFVDGPKDRIGLIAEDFHEVLGRGDEKYINGGDVQVALWLAVQQLTAQNKALTERINALEKELAPQQNQ